MTATPPALPAGVTVGVPGPIPTVFTSYRWGWAPQGLATRRQLAACGLRPGRQPIAGQILWRYRRPTGGGPSRPTRVAYLYRTDLALPKRAPTPAQLAALAQAMRVRHTCPSCGQDIGYCLPRRWSACLDCQEHDASATGGGAGHLDSTGVAA